MSSNIRQQQILDAMGIDQWVPKEHFEITEAAIEPVSPRHEKPEVPVTDNFQSPAKQSGFEKLKQQAVEDQPQPKTTPPSESYSAPDAEKIKLLDWSTLQQTVSECVGCELSQGRTQTVFGSGDQTAKWLIIGEAPGQQEDIQGEPFVGRAGLLLNNMLAAAGQPREKVYIANVVKCRPPGNRDPKENEAKACQSYLRRQVELIKPSLILVVGRIAAQSLLATTTPVGKLRGKVYEFPDTNIPMVITYHPAYLLRRPSEKAKSWQDLKLAMATYNAL